MSTYYLVHHGIKGQKWGVRRYQNEDGSLTPAGEKRYSKQYEKYQKKANKQLMSYSPHAHINAYNKVAREFNDGVIDAFNKHQEAKYGPDYAKREDYQTEFRKIFDERTKKEWYKNLADYYVNNPNTKKAMNLAEKYKMTEWNKLAKDNAEALEDLLRKAR